MAATMIGPADVLRGKIIQAEEPARPPDLGRAHTVNGRWFPITNAMSTDTTLFLLIGGGLWSVKDRSSRDAIGSANAHAPDSFGNKCHIIESQDSARAVGGRREVEGMNRSRSHRSLSHFLARAGIAVGFLFLLWLVWRRHDAMIPWVALNIIALAIADLLSDHRGNPRQRPRPRARAR